MVDTGSQLNVIDPALAAQLNLKLQGTVGLVATAAYSQASVGVLDSLQAGSQMVFKPLVIIQDLGSIQAADPSIRGVLGENFIAHFDLLIDYGRRLLCLDEAKLIENDVPGERIPLVTPKTPGNEMPSSHASSFRSISLKQESGRSCSSSTPAATAPMLYAGNRVWSSRYSSELSFRDQR